MKQDVVATVDTSVLISLSRVGALGALSTFFDRVLAPATVIVGLERGHKLATLETVNGLAFFERRTRVDEAVLKLLRDTKKSKAKRDLGEAEAVAQGVQFSVGAVLVDDRLGREWAQRSSLICHGMLWVLKGLRAAGMIEDLRPAFLKLSQS